MNPRDVGADPGSCQPPAGAEPKTEASPTLNIEGYGDNNSVCPSVCLYMYVYLCVCM